MKFENKTTEKVIDLMQYLRESLAHNGTGESPRAPATHPSTRIDDSMAKKFAGFHVDPTKGSVTGFSNKKELKAATDSLADGQSDIAVIEGAEGLEQFSVSQLVDLHNKLNPSAPVTKFKSKASAIETVYPLLGNAASGTTPAAPAAKAPKAPKAPSERKGRTSSVAGKTITRNQKDNPRRPGTHGAKAWDLITDGMTVEAYQAAITKAGIPGGLKHLQHDKKRNWVTIQ